jgi:hypothetical protein
MRSQYALRFGNERAYMATGVSMDQYMVGARSSVQEGTVSPVQGARRVPNGVVREKSSPPTKRGAEAPRPL